MSSYVTSEQNFISLFGKTKCNINMVYTEILLKFMYVFENNNTISKQKIEIIIWESKTNKTSKTNA